MNYDFTHPSRTYLACGRVDLRKGIDGLAALVQQNYKLDPFTDVLFLFCGSRLDRIKGLYWTGDGFILVYYRKSQGHRFVWPRNSQEARQITEKQLECLLSGLSIDTDARVEKYRDIHKVI